MVSSNDARQRSVEEEPDKTMEPSSETQKQIPDSVNGRVLKGKLVEEGENQCERYLFRRGKRKRDCVVCGV